MGGLFIARARAPEPVAAERVRPRLRRPQGSRGGTRSGEGEADKRQRVTETSSAQRREEEEDRGEEGDDGHGSELCGHWNDSPEKKTEGARGPEGRGRRGGAVGH